MTFLLKRPPIFTLAILSLLVTVGVSPSIAFAQDDIQEFATPYPQFSGIYPHLAFFNDEGECGTGAVVPWAERLWVVTYGPHEPNGSSDNLYEIDEALNLIIRPESIGGTPANRMIHEESSQLFIGPYAIDDNRTVRVIPYSDMPGRLTANARHLMGPRNQIYYATMEEGLYEVDVNSLAVTTLFEDTNSTSARKLANLPGTHGKGCYMGQKRLIYANNGEAGDEALTNPDIESGSLSEWDGESWKTIARGQFTDVTGPGGIFGSRNHYQDPVWSIGFDSKSLILMLLDNGKWHRFRLPKASHCYDGAHGWNTEWPRIRNIGDEEQDDFLMTMHGMFWRFPKSFSASNLAGIEPRSSYLKVVGDFCRWKDRIVLGCDDTANKEFLNKRKSKNRIPPPQSQSNLWFVEPEQLDRFGPPGGQGAVWLEQNVKPGELSDPFLVSGFELRGLHLCHQTDEEISFGLEVYDGDNKQWYATRTIDLQPHEYSFASFESEASSAWIRLRARTGAKGVTAMFTTRNRDRRALTSSEKFAGLAGTGQREMVGGPVRARDKNRRTLQFAAYQPNPEDESTIDEVGYFELDGNMKLKAVDDPEACTFVKQRAAVSDVDSASVDQASVIFIDDSGQRFRLPKSARADFDEPGPLHSSRLIREVVTERDLMNLHGTFYEVPAINAGGFSLVRPIASHNLRVKDFCSYRGLLVLSGIDKTFAGDNSQIVWSPGRKAALWLGAIDDLWELGKPHGHGGPWLNTTVAAGESSDPYLMNGYDHKALTLSTDKNCVIVCEVDISGRGLWKTYREFNMAAGETVEHEFPPAFAAYWVRFRTSADSTVTAQLKYD